MTTLAEDLLWLLLDDNTGALLIDRPQLSQVLGAAVYLETSGPAVVSKTPGSTRPPRIPRSTRAQQKMLLAGLVAEGRVCQAVDTLEQQSPGWHRSEIRRAATAVETYPECRVAADTLRHANQDAYATSFSGGIRPWLP
ncbi:hypothetical protein [Nocardia sp. NPDC004750]